MVRDSLIVGLADGDIRLDVLGQANQEMSLEETIRFIEAKESGKRSAGRINPKPTAVPVAVDAASSTYRQMERRRLQGRPLDSKAITQNQLCGHCGKAGHSSKKQERMNHCPAFNHICNNCNLPHHFESVCRKSRQKQRTNQSNSATAVFETLCSIEQFVCTITLDHHVCDSLCDVWE
ncbi:Zinc knuckle domain containing protein [Plakobranchus ocellatus]|uniref:Zinc knuckle domain containing protein n=1 Tax=Plakobranchus ocellatus TaxID=259542 RepID=A0AAV3ZFT4_9GAST|nr:Zinc knuckle domain containing protein [Plakobranchus ocellatus]